MKPKTTEYDYGECEICNTHMEEKLINQDFWIRGQLIVLEGVPAGVCPQCGEKVVRADVGRRIAELVDNPRRIAKARKIAVPALQFNSSR